MDEARYCLRYRSSRKEVWRWYWRAWRSKYGWWHLLLAASVTWLSLDEPFGLVSYLLRFAWIMPIVVASMAAWPQMAFKSQERDLEVGPAGWSTRIGQRSGTQAWQGVALIKHDSEVITIVGVSGNALLIPRRAFGSESSREAFLSDVRRWHSACRATV